MASQEKDWTKPQAMAIPKEGYFKHEQGNYGPVFPRTPACYGFTIIAKLKPGREGAMRVYADTIEKAMKADPFFLAPLKLHYLKWVLFDIGNDKYFMYQGIFDTDFDKYTDDAVGLFTKSGLNTAFENLEGLSGTLENERSGVRQVRSRLPSPQLYGIWRIPIRHN